MAREDQILRVVSIAAILAMLAIAGAFVKIYFLDRLTLTPAAVPPSPPPPGATLPAPDEPAPPPAAVDAAQVEKSIERAVARLNIMGIAANVMDLRGRGADAALLRNTMSGLEPGLANLAAMRGTGSLAPEHLAARDVIVRFRTFALTDFDKADAEKFLTDFLRHLRVGSRARVETKRGMQNAVVDITIRALPDDWPELVAVALSTDGTTGATPAPSAGPLALTAEQTDALSILVSPERRARGDDRLQAIYELSRLSERSGMSGGFYAAARLFLERGSDDPAVDEYFVLHGVGAAEKFTVAQHLSAAQWLADKRKKARDAEALLLFATGHLGDAWRRQGGGDPAFAKAMTAHGLQRADQPFGCGRPVDVAAIAVAGAIRAGAPQRAIDALSQRFKGVSDPSLQALRGYAELLVTKDARKTQDRLALLARACAQPDDAALLRLLADAAGDVAAGKSVDQVLARAPCSRCRERRSLIPGAALRCDMCNGLGFTLARP
jgi:hypothetical protein